MTPCSSFLTSPQKKEHLAVVVLVSTLATEVTIEDKKRVLANGFDISCAYEANRHNDHGNCRMQRTGDLHSRLLHFHHFMNFQHWPAPSGVLVTATYSGEGLRRSLCY